MYNKAQETVLLGSECEYRAAGAANGDNTCHTAELYQQRVPLQIVKGLCSAR